jgi:hypothetical protein
MGQALVTFAGGGLPDTLAAGMKSSTMSFTSSAGTAIPADA